jgi:hypothetical protein
MEIRQFRIRASRAGGGRCRQGPEFAAFESVEKYGPGTVFYGIDNRFSLWNIMFPI